MNGNEINTPEKRTELINEFKNTLWFYVFLTIVAIGIFITTLINDPSLRQVPLVVFFSLLFIIHTALHWLSGYLLLRPNLVYPYFILQSLIITALVFMSAGQWVIIGLFMAMIGSAVGILESFRRSVVVVAGILTLAIATFSWFNGWSSIPGYLIALLPMTLFVIVYVTLFTHQARSRVEAERLLHELEEAHQQLAEYAARVEDLTLASERQRMARELHDTLAQGLAGLILQLEATDSNLSKGHVDQSQKIVQQAMERARSTLAAAREAISDLRSAPPTPAELEQAIRQEANRFTSATGIPCELDMALLPTNITSSQTEHAMRMVSEGLTNIARHARASHVSIRLAAMEDGLAIEVQDDGVGFELSDVEKRGGHYGLIGLRERARLARGTIEVRSKPESGTSLLMHLPAEREEGYS
jgi:two-component system, NarL family, sensor histidine kinase YdfH